MKTGNSVLIVFAMVLTAIVFLPLGCGTANGETTSTQDKAEKVRTDQPEETFAEFEPFEGEKHFSKVRMLTTSGENAEAYFSYDGKKLIYQTTSGQWKCDQIHMMNIDGTGKQLISSGKGRTTCSYIAFDNSFIAYASTHELGDECPEAPDQSSGYAWALYKYDIFKANFDGSDPVNLTNSDSYDAEGVISPDGKQIVFSSTRTGDQEIFMMNSDGTDVKQLTFAEGYDGGPFWNWDGTKIVYRSYRPRNEIESAQYQDAIDKGLMMRIPLEIYVMDADGSNQIKLTDYGSASFAPFMHPDGKRIIFCSNMGMNPRIFNLFMINVDGSGLEQITFNDTFDGFPMFSRDGKYFVFCSNRHNLEEGNTNIFITEWVE